MAFHLCEQVLAVEPGNAEAVQTEYRIRDALREHGFSHRWDALYWSGPAGASVRRKLAKVIFPNVDFNGTSLEDAVDFCG